MNNPAFHILMAWAITMTIILVSNKSTIKAIKKRNKDGAKNNPWDTVILATWAITSIKLSTDLKVIPFIICFHLLSLACSMVLVLRHKLSINE